MTNILNTKIILSIATIVTAAALIAGATFAFFSDTETSTDNVFVAGALDLKVDSEAHYNGLVCREDNAEDGLRWLEPTSTDPQDLPELQALNHYDTTCVGTWSQTDLDETHKFFNLNDIKPGDQGENTISLHVTNNDAWGRFLVTNVVDVDNTCTEPEEESELDTCVEADGDNNTAGSGELGQSIAFSAWLDQGTVAGFQCNHVGAIPQVGPCQADLAEGNNLQDATPFEQLFWTGETIDEVAEGPFELSEVLSAAYTVGSCTVANGNTNYGTCHGLAQDGRMVGSSTYYFGLGWSVLDTVGNEAQTDSIETDLAFEVVQHRNNPTPFLP